MNLPPLLRERREKYSIPDACFSQVALFDRVLLWQIPLFDVDSDKVAPGSMLFATERSKDVKLTQAPRGVVVTAGLAALDYLWCNGVELGAIVKFVRLSPWHMPVDVVGGKEQYMQVVRVGDIVACEDLSWLPHEVARDEENGIHQLVINGKLRPRADTEPNDDY
jgi:hypothetical protein